MPRRLKNIRPWKGGWQAYTEIHGKTRSKSFPITTPVAEMRTWLKDQRDTHAPVKSTRGSFGADVAEYLTRVTALVTYAQRSKQLRMWTDALGADRPRRTITTTEIDRVLQGWLLAGLAPGTVKKRRMVLLSTWNTLDGKQAPNPVRASVAPREPKPEARGMGYDVVARILAAMPPRSSRRGPLRIAVLAWTGLPPGLLAKVERADLNLEARTLRVRPRRKGAGVEARTLPLLPQAVDAFRAFDQADAYGPYSITSLNQLFVRACRRATPPVTGVSLYDLRHSFGAMLYRVTKDLATVARFLLHANVAMAQRYAAGALVEVDRAAADLAGQTLSPIPVPARKRPRHQRLHV
jgi:integrase